MFVSIFLIYVKTSSSEDDKNLCKSDGETTGHELDTGAVYLDTQGRYQPKQSPKSKLDSQKKITLQEKVKNLCRPRAKGINKPATDKNTKVDTLPSSTIHSYQIDNLSDAELIKETKSNIASIEFAMNDLSKRLTLTDVKDLVETAKNNLLEELRAKLKQLVNETGIINSTK
ncbi:hypothetical protein COBT_002966 [Conglomerata obtusa]